MPQPFLDDRPPAELISVPDSIAIAVGSIEGEPRAIAAKLAAAMAKELLKHEIPASERTTSVGSYRLDGRIEETPPNQVKAVVTVFWRLRDPAGHIVVERHDQLEAAAGDWSKGSDDQVARLAALGAGGIAAFVTDEAPTEQQVANGRLRVLVRKVSGAPGDGDTSLAAAVGTILKRRDIDVVDAPGGKADLDLDATITVDPAKAGAQHVKIIWHVARAGGGEVGTVAQENDVPRGRLDGPWGDVAYSVAIAAEGGILELVGRGAPPLKVGGAPAPAARNAPNPAHAVPPVAGEKLPSNAGPAPAAPPLPLIDPPPLLDPAPVIPFRGVPLPQ